MSAWAPIKPTIWCVFPYLQTSAIWCGNKHPQILCHWLFGFSDDEIWKTKWKNINFVWDLFGDCVWSIPGFSYLWHLTEGTHAASAVSSLSCQGLNQTGETFQPCTSLNCNQTDKSVYFSFKCALASITETACIYADECLLLSHHRPSWTLCQETCLVNSSAFFFFCQHLKACNWPGLKCLGNFTKALTLIAKNDLQEWLMLCGGWWHKSVKMCLMYSFTCKTVIAIFLY